MITQWKEDFDMDDNSMWELDSPYTDSEGATEFVFRLKQRLRGNKIQWCEDSDIGLLADPQNPRTWDSLEEAKQAMESDYQDIVKECSGRS